MQQLLDKFRETTWYSADDIEQEFLDFGLPLEKQQIINAHRSGYIDGIESAEEYFKQEYEDGTN